MACLPFECIQIVNIWPFKLPVLGIAARIACYLSVREMPVEEFYEKGARLLEEGACIIAFPEGTRSGSRTMGPFNSSIFRLGQQCRATFVPLAISGNERIPPKGSLVLHPGRVFVDKLPAVGWEDYRNMDVFKLKNHVHRLLGEHLNRIEGELT
jgi:1-acyl-sn-glycerol-3-phosphate acyltransferase